MSLPRQDFGSVAAPPLAMGIQGTTALAFQQLTSVADIARAEVIGAGHVPSVLGV